MLHPGHHGDWEKAQDVSLLELAALFRAFATTVTVSHLYLCCRSHLGVATATAMCHRYYISMSYRQNDCFVRS